MATEDVNKLAVTVNDSLHKQHYEELSQNIDRAIDTLKTQYLKQEKDNIAIIKKYETQLTQIKAKYDKYCEIQRSCGCDKLLNADELKSKRDALASKCDDIKKELSFIAKK